MEKITGKEGKGVSGSGFEGRTGGNSYSALPKSSNAAFGIDADVASGIGEAVSNTKGMSAQNVGASEGKSSRKNLGYDEPWAKGTVAQYDERGEFGVSAKSGGYKPMGADIYGSGARSKGTASESGGDPGRTGSMALAKAGLSGGGRSSVSTNTDGPHNADRAKAKAGQSVKSQVGNN